MQPFVWKRRTPFVAGENAVGSGLLEAMTFNTGNVVELLLNPLAIVIDHSPGCVNGTTAVYSPLFPAGFALAVMTRPPVDVARTVGCSPSSNVFPCCLTAKVNSTGFPAMTYSGKSRSVLIAQPPASALVARIDRSEERRVG